MCLFGLLIKNELDEGSTEILCKIKETLAGILRPLYEYKTEIVNIILKIIKSSWKKRNGYL